MIPFFDYSAVFTADEDAYLGIVREVIRRGAFIQQRDLADFEACLASYVGVRHAVGVGSATDGLLLAIEALGVGAGDEVILPSHTMVATAASVVRAGATPVPVDCGSDHLIDPDAVAAAVSARTRLMIPVHLNGRTCRMDVLEAIARQHDLFILEDAAQALGSSYRGRRAGSFGAAAAFSFYPAKLLGCLGDGGAVLTADDAIARKLSRLRDHGRNEEGEVECWGINSRLDNLQAAILHHQFRRFETSVARRRSLASHYDARLRDLGEVFLPPPPDSHVDHFDVYQNYEIEADRRDLLRTYLLRQGIGTNVAWGGKAVHQFSALGFDVRLPHTERVFERCLMLPLNPMVSDDDVDRVCEAIREFYGA